MAIGEMRPHTKKILYNALIVSATRFTVLAVWKTHLYYSLNICCEININIIFAILNDTMWNRCDLRGTRISLKNVKFGRQRIAAYISY